MKSTSWQSANDHRPRRNYRLCLPDLRKVTWPKSGLKLLRFCSWGLNTLLSFLHLLDLAKPFCQFFRWELMAVSQARPRFPGPCIAEASLRDMQPATVCRTHFLELYKQLTCYCRCCLFLPPLQPASQADFLAAQLLPHLIRFGNHGLLPVGRSGPGIRCFRRSTTSRDPPFYIFWMRYRYYKNRPRISQLLIPVGSGSLVLHLLQPGRFLRRPLLELVDFFYRQCISSYY